MPEGHKDVFSFLRIEKTSGIRNLNPQPSALGKMCKKKTPEVL
jgi:hypothetical protein